MQLTKLICLAVLILVIGISGCKQESPTEGTRGTWPISGKCYLVGSTEPIAGVVVTCGSVSTTSGQDGVYTITGLPAGTQTLTAQKAGLIAYTGSIEITSEVTFNIFMDFRRTNVSGYVSNAVDGPIGGARVTLGSLIDVTDISGRFEFHNVAQRAESVIVVRSPYNSSLIVLPGNEDSVTVSILLSRDSTFSGSGPGLGFVDQSRPTYYFPRYPYTEHVMIRSNGIDSSGAVVTGVESIAYLFFQFPSILSDPRVTLVEASVEVCTDSAYDVRDVEVYRTIGTIGSFALSYNNRYQLGGLLSTAKVGGNSSQYCTVLGTKAMNELLADFRSEGTGGNVALKATAVYPIKFYSSAGGVNKPRSSFTIRY